MAVNSWVGCVVTIECGDIMGCYQGHVSSVDDRHQTISLIQAFRNGIQCKVPEITICAQDIKDLKILQPSNSLPLIPHQRCLSDLEMQVAGFHLDAARSSPERCDEHKRRTQSVSETRRKATTPKRIETRNKKWQEKNEACFSAPIDSAILENDFDFEKNLALFDKQAVFEEINAESKPDLVRLVDCNRKPHKYRCDENVLEQLPAVYRQITVPMPDQKEYVTDSGLVVPSIQLKLRANLLAAAEKHGLTSERQLEMIGRAASEMVLHLLGGSHRINPHNTHQKPVVVVLCGPHFQGAQGLTCGRHLANHGSNVYLFLPSGIKMPPLLASELGLFKLTDGNQVSNVKDLPTGAIDIIICALDDHEGLSRTASWYKNISTWSSQCRAPTLTLDPPAEGTTAIPPKWALVPALPMSVDSIAGSSLYLCDLGIPEKVFAEVGITYDSPFGSKFVIPLHANRT